MKGYNKKVAEIDYMYDLGLRGPEYKKITAQLCNRKVSYKSDEEWVAALSSMVDNIRHNPLSDDIKKEALWLGHKPRREPQSPSTLHLR